jgi:23S rRNA pseudouridine2605 synthase
MANPETTPKGDRIAKVLARAGLCSRREAERWITAGRVSVNGKVLDSPAITVGANDQVVVDGKPLPTAEATRLWRYHKPPGLMTTNKDPEGRPTVFERLPKDMPRVMSVGRLDLNSEGLLLLTNDGDLSRRLELPEMGWSRKYRVRVHGHVDEGRLENLKKGITVEGVHYAPIDAALEKATGHNSWLSVTLREGKNREIRRVMEALGLSVNRLIRTAYGPFQLGNLVRGGVVEMPPKVLRENLQIRTERPNYRKPPR